MIAITSASGNLIKTLPGLHAGKYGFHPTFGFISEAAASEREVSRKRRGLFAGATSWVCQFQVESAPADGAPSLKGLAGCKIENAGNGVWKVATSIGEFLVNTSAAVDADRLGKAKEEDKSKIIWVAAALALLIALFGILVPQPTQQIAVPEVIEPVTIKIEPQKQKTVVVKNMDMPKNIQDQKLKRAVMQDLGFLGLVGKQNLTKAIGGVPTSLKDASPGAGPGGKEGSGGEVLVGLGQGVKRITVGNSGVAGLGGIGTKGRGGGAGGYGNTLIASGEGKTLTSVPLSKDMVLEGGLDRNVVMATVAKYMSQVRVCYEEGLQRNRGLQGQVSVAFVVNGVTGKLNSANVSRSTLGDAKVEGCIVNRMMGWQFPKGVGGVDTNASHPFMLRPVSS